MTINCGKMMIKIYRCSLSPYRLKYYYANHNTLHHHFNVIPINILQNLEDTRSSHYSTSITNDMNDNKLPRNLEELNLKVDTMEKDIGSCLANIKNINDKVDEILLLTKRSDINYQTIGLIGLFLIILPIGLGLVHNEIAYRYWKRKTSNIK